MFLTPTAWSDAWGPVLNANIYPGNFSNMSLWFFSHVHLVHAGLQHIPCREVICWEFYKKWNGRRCKISWSELSISSSTFVYLCQALRSPSLLSQSWIHSDLFWMHCLGIFQISQGVSSSNKCVCKLLVAWNWSIKQPGIFFKQEQNWRTGTMNKPGSLAGGIVFVQWPAPVLTQTLLGIMHYNMGMIWFWCRLPDIYSF